MYHINSISLNSDDETYLSADDLRINLWHLDSTTECYNVVDIKPVNMEELTEVCPVQCLNYYIVKFKMYVIRCCQIILKVPQTILTY